jgi:hypothetical protein
LQFPSIRVTIEKLCKASATILHREGKEIRAEINTSPILDKDNGSVAGVVAILRKIADRCWKLYAIAARIASVNCVVPAVPPTSRVNVLRDEYTVSSAFCVLSAAAGSSR